MTHLGLLLALSLAACGALPDRAPAAAASPSCPGGVPGGRPRFVEWRGACLAELAGGVVERGVLRAAPGARRPDGLLGVVSTPPVALAAPFREAIVSWNAETPPGSWIEVRLAAGRGERWTTDYVLGVWSTDPARRHSVAGQRDADGEVKTDTLVLRAPADRLRVSVRFFAAEGAAPSRLHGLAVATSDAGGGATDLAPLTAAWGRALDVPPRSQNLYPDGGGWCSPTSTSMVLAYWAGVLGRGELDESVPAAAAATHDATYGGTGNWAFNTAHAFALGGGELRAVVARLQRIEQLERLVAGGVPVIVSARWERGQLTSAMDRSDGHLIVVRGFDAAGDVLVNDPAAPSDAEARRTYRRAELDAAWARSRRTVYLIHPAARPLPADGALGSW